MVIIIGTGPAGLSTSYHLRDVEHLLVDKDPEPGGMCKSFELGGAVFDLGGHAFYTAHTYVQNLITNVFGVDLYRQPRRAWVYSHDEYVPYPFQCNLFGLPLDVVKESLVGLYDALLERSDAPVTNLADWIDRSFGAGIAKHFMRPYNEKLWAHPLEEVSFEWTPRRVVSADVEAIVEGALTRSGFNDFPNHHVFYPAKGGYFNLYQGFLAHTAERRHNDAVVSVNLAKKYIVTESSGRIDYEYLVSTMPLDELIEIAMDAPTCCRAAAAKLKFNSLFLVNLVYGRPKITDKHRVYSADPTIPFHKLVVNSTASPDLFERETFGIQGEVSFSPHKHVARSGLEERMSESLVRIGFTDPDDDIVASSVVTLPHAYPVYTQDTPAAREHLLSELENRGVYCAGRFGEWMYLCSDEAVMRGRMRAEQVGAKVGALV